MFEPKTGTYTDDVVVTNYQSISFILNSVQSTKFGQLSNEALLDDIFEINGSLGTNSIAPDLRVKTTIVHDQPGDKNTITVVSFEKPEEIIAFLQIIRLQHKEISDDGTILSEYKKRIAASGDKLKLVSPYNIQSGDNQTLIFDIVSIANGGSVDFPVEADGLTIYEKMFKEFISVATNKVISIGTFGTGDWAWITAAFDPNDTSPTSWRVTFNTDSVAKRKTFQQIGDIVEAGIYNIPLEIKAAGAVLAA